MTLIPDLERDLVEAAERTRSVRRRLRARLAVATAAGLAALSVLGIATLGGGEGGSAPAQPRPGNAAPLDPADLTVCVLNGTVVPGRAAALADQLQAAGYRLGTISNAPTRQSKSLAMYANGHAPDARAVANSLGISRVRRMDRAVKELAGPAAIAIIIGRDLAREP